MENLKTVKIRGQKRPIEIDEEHNTKRQRSLRDEYNESETAKNASKIGFQETKIRVGLESQQVGFCLPKRSIGRRHCDHNTHHKDPLRILNTAKSDICSPKVDLSNKIRSRRRRKKRRHSPEKNIDSFFSTDSRHIGTIQSQPSQQNKFLKRTPDYQKRKAEDVSMSSDFLCSSVERIPSCNVGVKSDHHEQIERRKIMAERYRYGNFNFYYQKKRYSSHQLQPSSLSPNIDSSFQPDPRVDLFLSFWFAGKTVLDVGCNTGIFTISLALRYRPHRIVGIDIDQHLINAARKNLRYLFDRCSKFTSKFPASFSLNFGPVSVPSTQKELHDVSNNIRFVRENYILSSDEKDVTEEYDIVIALATIKWIHLNWGDAGVKRFFAKVFLQLKSNGRFILETESFNSYKKHCSGSKLLPDDTLEIFKSIQLMPENFTSYLIENVGFSHVEEMDTPLSKSMGVSGRLQVFYKGKFMIEYEDQRDIPMATTSAQAIEEGGRFLQQQQMLTTPPTMDSMSPYEPSKSCDGFTPEQNGIDEWSI